MSFALCEILFKSDGGSRLQKLREKNAHHGLDFSVKLPRAFRGQVGVDDLSVAPLQRGTFAVWHKVSRQSEIFCDHTEITGSSQTTGLQQVTATGSFGPLPQRLSLREVAEICPATFNESVDLGLKSRLARATLESKHNNNDRTATFSLIVHPTPADVLNKISEKVTFSAQCVDLVVPREYPHGIGFKITYPDAADYVGIKLPFGLSISKGSVFFSADDFELNEFGIYYLAAYIGGMFARYYPEYWTRALDSGSQTFQVIDSIMSAALARAPLLLLGEFRDRCYMYE